MIESEPKSWGKQNKQRHKRRLCLRAILFYRFTLQHEAQHKHSGQGAPTHATVWWHTWSTKATKKRWSSAAGTGPSLSQHSTAAFRVNEPPEDTGGQTMRPSVVPSSGSGETHGRVQKIPSIPALLLLGSVDEDREQDSGLSDTSSGVDVGAGARTKSWTVVTHHPPEGGDWTCWQVSKLYLYHKEITRHRY